MKKVCSFCLASILLLAICPPGLASVVYEKNGFTINALEGRLAPYPIRCW